jgi:hypothetical protein
VNGPWLTRIGAALVMGGCVLTIWQMRRARTAHPPVPYDRPLAEVLEVERARLTTQIRLLRTIPWWYAVPLSVGVVLVYAGAAGPGWGTLIYAATVAAIAAAIIALNRRAVREELLPARDALDRLREQLRD